MSRNRRASKLIASLLLSLTVAACASIDWAPVNGPQVANEGGRAFHSLPTSEDGYMVGLSFSGGGTRAAAFSYGVLDGLRASVDPETRRPLLDQVRFVSSVSGGSVTAAYYGLFGKRIFEDFEKKFLYADAEAGLTTTIGPGVIQAAISGGINDRTRLPRWFEQNLFGAATMSDLLARSPRTVLNATDVYGRVPFPFSYETFNAICSDPSSVPVADAVAASAAVPIAFVPIVLQVYKNDCRKPLPAWVRAARQNPSAPPKLRAMAKAWESYRNDPEINFLKLADGGITDNYGLSSVSTFLDSIKGANQNPADLVKIRRLLVIVVDSGQEQTATWTRTPDGSNGIQLAQAAMDTGLEALARTNLDLFARELREWKQDTIAARCRLGSATVAKFVGDRRGWRCDDVEAQVLRVSFDDLGAQRARELSSVPTRFALPAPMVNALIQAGRDVIHARPWKMRNEQSAER